MRKLNIFKTEKNINSMAVKGILYSFYGLTENKEIEDYMSEQNAIGDMGEAPKYAIEQYRFSCEGNPANADDRASKLVDLINKMQEAYLIAMNLKAPLFEVVSYSAKGAPYSTVVVDMTVKTVRGAFQTIVNCAGPDLHQFHASDIWVRANTDAEVWKSLYDYNPDSVQLTNDDNAVVALDSVTAEIWLDKVIDARKIAKDCITTAGEPSEADKRALDVIMRR